MQNNDSGIDIISNILGDTTKKILEANTQKKILYSKTMLSIPKVSLRPEIGCFVQFYGDYNGLVVLNFSAESAMIIYKNYMTLMGIPEKELALNFTSVEVPDSIGELINQILGASMKVIEDRYDLTAACGQPKALILNSAITLSIDSDFRDNRRIVFNIERRKFYMELAMESTEFIQMK